MIERDLLTYLQGYSGLTSLIGNKIYVIQAPQSGVSMPWVIIENTSGTRRRITQDKTEEMAYVRITVDSGPNQVVLGRNIAEKAKEAIENFRGALGLATDVEITCGSVRGWAGIGGAFRYQFDATARFIEPYIKP